MADTLTDLQKEAKRHQTNEQWGRYRNTRYETAEHVRGQDNWKQALALYIEVMIFDLQGVTSGQGEDGFSQAHRGETPSVARELARISLRQNLDAGALKATYDRIATRCWIEAFPRSRPEVWEEMREGLRGYRASIQLRERVESLDAGQLLPPGEAETYAEHADDYELIRRVGTLLADASTAGIPWMKRKRAHRYLKEVDIDRVGDRWKAKAYRWAGEVVLSNDETKAALDYFEKALRLADQDDQAPIKHRVKRLRRTLEPQ